MAIKQTNPNSDNQPYESAVANLSSTVTAKIFEQGFKSDEPGAPALVESNDGQVYSLSGYTGEKGPETVIDKVTGRTVRYVIDANGIVWDSGVDEVTQKTPLDKIYQLNGNLSAATPVSEARRSEFIVAEIERDRGFLPMGVLQAEAMPLVPGATLTEAESRAISKRNNRGPLKKLGNAVTAAFVSRQ